MAAEDMARFLLHKEVDVNLLGEQGTALHSAAYHGGPALRVTKFLIGQGADVNL